MIQHDTAASVQFLQMFHPTGGWNITAISTDRKNLTTRNFGVDDTELLTKFLDESSARKLNIYFAVNPLMRAMEKKASERDVLEVRYLHVDIDPRVGEDIREEQNRILALLQKNNMGVPEPTAVVFSGGGYQAFWQLQEPISIRGSQAAAEDTKLYNRQLESIFGGDSCHNIDRIMRLPGTINWPTPKKIQKGQQPVQSQLIWWRPGNVYPITTFTKAPKVQDMSVGGSTGDIQVEISGNVPKDIDLDKDLPSSVSGRVRVAIVQGSNDEEPLKGDNGRSEWLFYVVCELVRAGVSDDMIYAIITDPTNGISSSVLDKGNSRSVERYAIRQIQRAKEHSEDPELERLNREYALVESVGGRCRVVKEVWNPALKRHEIDLQDAAGFLKVYGNRFVPVGKSDVPLGKWWMSHKNRRTYSTILFDPTQDHPGALNLWRGFAVEAIPGDCSTYLTHLRDNLCQGNEDWYNYLIGWMANVIQNPGQPGQTAVVLRGRQGTGKGFFAKTFGHLLGCHYKVVTNPDHLVGKFNAHLEDAVLVFADEALYAGNKKHENVLKSIITEATLPVEAKFQDARETRNCVHLVMASNEDWVVPASLDDRRFFVLKVGDDHRQDTGYFGRIQAQMSDGGYEALLHHLISYDLSNFNIFSVPKTDELRNQQTQSLSPIQSFWYHRLQDGKQLRALDSWKDSVMKEALTSELMREDRRLTFHGAQTSMAMFLKQTFGIRRDDVTRVPGMHAYTDESGRELMSSNPWAWVFPDLDTCRSMWENNFGPQTWQKVEDQPQQSPPDSPF